MPDNGGPDVLVQISAVGFGASVTDGQKVSHDVGQDRKTGKSKAENVTVLQRVRRAPLDWRGHTPHKVNALVLALAGSEPPPP